MARIETYPFDLAPTVNDYVIGTDGDNLNVTRNYKVMTFLDYLGTQYNLNSTDMLFEYDDVISTAVGDGYVSTNNYADGTILMSGVTNIYVSKLTGFGQLVEDALNSIGDNGLTILFADMGNRNNYGIFEVVSAADVDANTINLTVTATTTLGTLTAGRSMGIRIGIGGGGGNFVTIDTIQDITGRKTFQSATSSQVNFENTSNGRTTAIGQGSTFNVQIGAGAGFDLRVNGDGAASFYIDTAGVVTLANLAGVGDRMVVADASGNLSTQAISGAPSQGTWTPTLTDLGGGATYSATSDCHYIRIGNLVHIYVNLSSWTTTGTPTGAFEMTLPFNSDLSFQSLVMGQLFYGSGAGSPSSTPTTQVIPTVWSAADNKIRLIEFPSTTTLSSKVWVTNGFLRFSGTYIAEAV